MVGDRIPRLWRTRWRRTRAAATIRVRPSIMRTTIYIVHNALYLFVAIYIYILCIVLLKHLQCKHRMRQNTLYFFFVRLRVDSVQVFRIGIIIRCLCSSDIPIIVL